MNKTVKRLMISGPKRGEGKTTISIGLSRCLSRKYKLQTFKKGPDYIDSLWLTYASFTKCYNLDLFMMGESVVKESFKEKSQGAEISLIEGNQGLYDSVYEDGRGSNAYLSRLLEVPLVLVINTQGLNRSIAALIQGYVNFEKETQIKGVILNKVGGQRHEQKLLSAIKNYTNIEVLGVIPKAEKIEISERHMGLTPFVEDEAVSKRALDEIEYLVNENVNLERVLEISKVGIKSKSEIQKAELGYKSIGIKVGISDGKGDGRGDGIGDGIGDVRIGIVKDQAFHFYYPENLKGLEDAGAKLLYIDTLKDKKLPKLNGLYIGGGFPELFLNKFSKSLMDEIKLSIEGGLAVYAECGGLMYLSKSISYKGCRVEMVGALPLEITQGEIPQGFGYCILELKEDKESFINATKGFNLRGHEFHYSRAKIATEAKEKLKYLYKVKKGYGLDGKNDGLLYKNVLASYAHLHSLSYPQFSKDFVLLAKTTTYQT